MFKKGLLFFIAALAWLCLGSAQAAALSAEGPRYFKDFYTNYTHPFGVSKEISREEAKALKAYIVAFFDKAERVVSITKVMEGQCEFWFQYEYGANGELSRTDRRDCKDWASLD